MKTYIVRGIDQDGDSRVAVIVTAPRLIGVKALALRWSQYTVEMVADHLTVVI